ncbi:MAG: peptidoglycan DD-metalloendopeptidase family protein [Gammaproteobacteria bacterium]
METSPSIEDKTAELESVRRKIEDVQTGIQAAHNKTANLQEKLRMNEITAGEIKLKLKDIEQQLIKKQNRIDEFNNINGLKEKELAIERKKLAKQIRAAYMSGRNDYLKLVLNQEDPALLGRVLAYYDYHTRARTRQIKTITEKIDATRQLQQAIQLENESLRNLKAQHLSKNDEIKTYRKSRIVILTRLEDYINEQGLQLQSLQQQEYELKTLLEKLGKSQDSVTFYEDIPPFNNLKGKLQWPAQGKLLNRFGSRRKGGDLTWQGVKINAKPGSEVRAISTGKVIFADWFKNLGLLMILDHGDGYMTLYGHNQNLLKTSGDWVLEDEVIAYSGDSGGQKKPSLYFEIRHRGKPLNPVLWCKK